MPKKIQQQLRRPGLKADMLIEHYLGNPGGASGARPYTRDLDAALSLVPEGVHFLSGRFEDGLLFWCDLGCRPQVQAWGESLPAAIAGAALAWHLHPQTRPAGLATKKGAAGRLH
ncbi:MAG: hypothetical protein LJE84_02855 [Gammaproteobacteria bacterium]|nr:hypothetical protein [Gammaproteobacteria bacterium]